MHAHGLVPPLNCMVMLCERLFYGCSTVVLRLFYGCECRGCIKRHA